MASALLELRKQAGFKNARDFAAAQGIADATYARYESSPDKIPLRSAWQLADRFGVPIDVIVGRQHVDVANLRGEVQEVYDALSESSQASLRDYLAFLLERDEQERQQRTAAERRRYDAVCYRLEQVFLAGLEKSDPELFAFGDAGRIREAFEKFLNARVGEGWGFDTSEPVEQVMAAYDRAHGSFQQEGVGVAYAVTDLRNPSIREEFNHGHARRRKSR